MTFRKLRHDASGQPLAALAAVVMDTETTGLDVARDRVIEIAAARLAGKHVEASGNFQTLVDPGVPIPPGSTAIHGIADADVSGARDFAAAMAAFSEWAADAVVIGYSIGFDLAILKAEHARHGLKWHAPRSLDVRHLVQIVAPELPAQSLETAAGWLGIEITDRHRALGDAMLTARIYCGLIDKLRDRNIVTLAQAERACLRIAERSDVEQHAGWHEVVASDRLVPGSVADYARIDSFPYRHRVGDIMHSPPATIAATASLSDALRLLMERRISSVFVPPDTGEEGHGILTERDILRAVDATGGDALNRPVSGFAVRPLVTIGASEFVYRAIAGMAAKGFRHLGVVDEEGGLVGALSARDLLKQRASDALSLGDSIERARTPAALGSIWSELTTVARGLVFEEVDARDIAAVISRELRALTRRACELAEQSMAAEGRGNAPCRYAMLVLGSGGRGESLLAMDQDNAIIFETGEPGGAADQWFAELGVRVADTLNEAGVAYCKGGIMASRPEWRKDVAGWRDTISGWVGKSRPEDLLSSDIFFDARPVHGDYALGDSVRREAVAAVTDARGFLQAMSMNANDFKVPVGWLGRFKLEDGRMDLKMGGIMPIFGAARVVALRHGITKRSTAGRLEAARELDVPGGHFIADLLDAHRIILGAILRQQLRDLSAGIALSNKVAPGELDGHERQELHWALDQVGKVSDLLQVPALGR